MTLTNDDRNLYRARKRTSADAIERERASLAKQQKKIEQKLAVTETLEAFQADSKATRAVEEYTVAVRRLNNYLNRRDESEFAHYERYYQKYLSQQTDCLERVNRDIALAERKIAELYDKRKHHMFRLRLLDCVQRQNPDEFRAIYDESRADLVDLHAKAREALLEHAKRLEVDATPIVAAYETTTI